MPSTIFWPLDVRQSGYCYGWNAGSVCVAGVFDVDSLDQAEGMLQNVRHLPKCKDILILGRCSYSNNHTLPSLDFPLLEEYILMFYTRNLPRSLRFYSLTVIQLDQTEHSKFTPPSFHEAAFSNDPTAFNMKSSTGIDQHVIEQFNNAMNVSLAFHKRSQPNRQVNSVIRATCDIFSNSLALPCKCLALLTDAPLTFSTPPLLLKDISNTLQQIDMRAEQSLFLGTDVAILSRRETMPMDVFCARYTNFFNTVWLILNDITIGLAVGSFICDNNIALANILNSVVTHVLIDWVQWVLRWLDSWPAGLKLNTELSSFYSLTLIYLVGLWGAVLKYGEPYLATVLYAFGLLSCGGVTMSMSLFSDLLTVVTVHIYACYIVTNFIYGTMLSIAGSLWNLFRGKRYNVLRNRTDSWEYDMDQLLFGTILFTLLAFLFPTVVAYYSLFALMRLGTMLLYALMETHLAFMNHFPLFALMLRVKDPQRLPGGIYFDQRPSEKGQILVVKNQPIPFSSIFFQYIRLWSRLSSHYNLLRLGWCLLVGEFIAPIPRYSIRYNKLRSD